MDGDRYDLFKGRGEENIYSSLKKLHWNNISHMKNTGAVPDKDIPAPHESTFEHSTFSFKTAK